MPFYEFKCPSCGGKVELLCKMGTTGEELACTACGHLGLEKMISGFCALGTSSKGSGCAGCQGKNCASCH